MAQHIRHGEISSREAVHSVLERIEEVNPQINALTHVFAEQAIQAATQADQLRRQGLSLGLLHGVPVTVKVNTDVAGEPTTHGVVSRRAHVAAENSPVVRNLYKAGAVIVGRSNTPAYSTRWFTDNDLHGQTRNPWAEEVTPGGSSGGAAAAVACGMGAIAHGNDLAGSIRYPAYACGVVGLRPTSGRVPSFNPSSGDGRTFAAQSFTVQGPLARNVADIELALAAMSVRDVRDPNWVDVALKSQGPVARTVALLDEIDGVDIDQPVYAALHQAARWLEDRGWRVERIKDPGLTEASRVWMAIAMTEIRQGLDPLIRQSGDVAACNALDAMLGHQASDGSLREYVEAFALRDALRRRWNLVLEHYSVILMPTSCELPFPVGLDQQGHGAMRRILLAQSPLMAIAALNLPGLSVPTGFVEKVPVGVQVVSGAFREDLCLLAGEAIETASGMGACRILSLPQAAAGI